ncbi:MULTISPECIES: universal stress protein [unclassified Tardiphaga]|uniref:universal stress protein n=1 Tax=unclassified Tardiphaga TaxID=2631404 RepID=UPI001164DFEF|nr:MULTISPECIES: universal stress protein [unclassified Tardiphaga]QDM15700.1 universal stress protein [Tardiphaga sp. vice278]QDM20763.1 universal stress protein [Tardiphaga sp. vice154]
MLKRILVHIPSEQQARPVIDGAISFAVAQNASLNAISIGYESTVVGFAMEGGTAVAAAYDIEHDRALARAAASSELFEAEARLAGVTSHYQSIVAMSVDAGPILGAAARLHDLTIVQQPDFDRESYDNSVVLDVLMESGGPVLFIPYTHHGALPLARVGIAWDGGRLAARAVRDAMPLLRKADSIQILSINEPATATASAVALSDYLAQHGLEARVERSTADGSDIQPALLSLAADCSLDLLVMGGYGHSRLQERIFGGVTRAMFRAMTVPTLMTH